MVDKYKLEFTGLQKNILRFLFLHTGKSFTAHSLAVNLNVSQTAIAKALPELEKRNFVTSIKDKETKRLSIELVEENPRINKMKRVENLNLIYKSGLDSFLEEKFPEGTIILFGSFSYGEDHFDSDIDIAVIGAKEKSLDLEKFENIFEKEININFYESLKKINKHLRNNILNGIILSGRIDL